MEIWQLHGNICGRLKRILDMGDPIYVMTDNILGSWAFIAPVTMQHSGSTERAQSLGYDERVYENR